MRCDRALTEHATTRLARWYRYIGVLSTVGIGLRTLSAAKHVSTMADRLYILHAWTDRKWTWQKECAIAGFFNVLNLTRRITIIIQTTKLTINTRSREYVFTFLKCFILFYCFFSKYIKRDFLRHFAFALLSQTLINSVEHSNKLLKRRLR